MIATTHLEYDLYSRFSHVQVDPFAHVLDLDQVGAMLGKEGQQTCEATWPITDAGEHDEASTPQGLMPSNEPSEKTKICIAA